jgi:hypothetical protein
VTQKVENWVGMKGFPMALEVNMKIAIKISNQDEKHSEQY